MKQLFNTFINLDAPMPWGIYFQDSATPQMEGLVELHDNIMYYLVLIFIWGYMNTIFCSKKFCIH